MPAERRTVSPDLLSSSGHHRHRHYSQSENQEGSLDGRTYGTRSPAYSDNFDSDYEKEQPQRRIVKKPPIGRKPPAKNKGKFSPRQLDVVTQRMLSAKRLKVNDLKSEIDELKRRLEEVTSENKILKRQMHRNEKALEKFDDNGAELPALITRHNEDVKQYREQIRRYKEKYEQSDRRTKELDAELYRARKTLKKLKDLAESKNLEERDVLARRVDKLVDESSEKDNRIQELEKHVANLQKNHRHELAIEVHRHKETQKRTAEVNAQIRQLEVQIKEKDKILEIQNIYSQRVVRAPHRLSAVSSSSLTTPAGLQSQRPPKGSSSSYERYSREHQSSSQPPPSNGPATVASREEIDSTAAEIISVRTDLDSHSEYRQKETSEENRLRQEHEKEMLEKMKRLAELEEFQRKIMEQEDKHRREAELEEEERRRKAEDDERRRLAEEEEVRRQEHGAEQARFIEEERKRKNDLLAKMQELDSSRPAAEPATSHVKQDLVFTDQLNDKTQPKYSAPKHGIQNGSDDEDDIPEIPTLDLNSGRQINNKPMNYREDTVNSKSSGSSHNSKKYNFTNQIENMHQGKPAALSREQVDSNETGIGYVPTTEVAVAKPQPKFKTPLGSKVSLHSASPSSEHNSRRTSLGATGDSDSVAVNKLLPKRSNMSNQGLAPALMPTEYDPDDVEELIL